MCESWTQLECFCYKQSSLICKCKDDSIRKSHPGIQFSSKEEVANSWSKFFSLGAPKLKQGFWYQKSHLKFTKATTIWESEEYSEIPLLRPPKIKTFCQLKTLFAKFKLFVSSFSSPSVSLIRDHLWDCPKVVFKTTFGQSQRWSYYRNFTVLYRCIHILNNEILSQRDLSQEEFSHYLFFLNWFQIFKKGMSE